MIPLKHSKSEAEEFVYLVSHDLRSSVRSLRDLPEWIQEDLSALGAAVPDHVNYNVDLLVSRMARLDRQLSDLLIYSRIGRSGPPGPVAARQLIAKVAEGIAGASEIELNLHLDDAPIHMVQSEAFWLFNALLSNTIKHADKTPVEVTITITTDDNETKILVADNGPGIAADKQEDALRPMTSLRAKDEVEGSGLGLTIARQVALSHGGDIALGDDAKLGGLCVTVTLPAAPAT